MSDLIQKLANDTDLFHGVLMEFNTAIERGEQDAGNLDSQHIEHIISELNSKISLDNQCYLAEVALRDFLNGAGAAKVPVEHTIDSLEQPSGNVSRLSARYYSTLSFEGAEIVITGLFTYHYALESVDDIKLVDGSREVTFNVAADSNVNTKVLSQSDIMHEIKNMRPSLLVEQDRLAEMVLAQTDGLPDGRSLLVALNEFKLQVAQNKTNRGSLTIVPTFPSGPV